MRELLFKIKGFLGICQLDNCWERAEIEVMVNAIDRNVKLCTAHRKEFIREIKIK